MKSPYDGRSRGPLVVGLAAVAAADLVMLTAAVGSRRATWLAWTVPVAIVGLVAAARFARRQAPISAALVTILALATLSRADGALYAGPRHNFFASGAALLGWTVGLAVARRWPPARGGDPEGFAESGAHAALAAVYVNAGIGKLLLSGFGWSDAATLRTLLASVRPVDGHGSLDALARTVVDHPGAAHVLAVMTMLIQVGAVAWLFVPQLRRTWGALLIGFHAGVFLLTGLNILYFQQMILVALWSWPWPRPAARSRPVPVVEEA